jgi:Protein of unknown function (DUF4236)
MRLEPSIGRYGNYGLLPLPPFLPPTARRAPQLGKRSASVSVGVRGAHVTLGGPQGTRTTVGLPGTGLSYTEVSKPAQAAQDVTQEHAPQSSAGREWLWIVVLIVAAVGLVIFQLGCATTPQTGADQVHVAMIE